MRCCFQELGGWPGCGPCLSCAAVLLQGSTVAACAAAQAADGAPCQLLRVVQHRCRQINACRIGEAGVLESSAPTASKCFAAQHNVVI